MNILSNNNRVLWLAILFNLLFFGSCQLNKAEIKEFKFLEHDISMIQEGYLKGLYTINDVVDAYLERIKEIDKSGPNLNSIIQINPNLNIEIAQLDDELKKGNIRGPLHGIPILLKDNIDMIDMPTTAGSRAMADSYPLSNSFIKEQLEKAGAVIIGKTNLSEWANFRGEGSTSGWSGLGGQTKNPYILSCNPCGSSSGSAVAVSANLTILSIGTETNGSIVCPANNNGVVGIKPTVGLVSRSGIIPISHTQDTPGPMARTVKDAVICLGVLTGIDSTDNKSLLSEGKFHADYTKFLKQDGLKGKRIGIHKGAFNINNEVDSIMYEAIEHIKNEGAEVIEIDSLMNPTVLQNSFLVMLYEYKKGLNDYFKSLGEKAAIKSIDELIAFNEIDSIELKYFNQKYLYMTNGMGDLSSEEYINALEFALQESRENGIDRVMDKHNLDGLIAQTGGPAWQTDLVHGDRYELGSSSPAAISGYPSITVPMGNIKGLPVGISFFGKAWSEPTLIEMAYAFEYGTKHRIVPKYISTDSLSINE